LAWCLEKCNFWGKYICKAKIEGVGYVYDLAKNRWSEWLKKAIERLHVNDIHNKECINGCIKCIVTLNTNKVLPRRQAYDYLQGEYVPEEKIKSKPKKTIKKPELSAEERRNKFKK
jgi:hypothetical protein